MRDLGSQKWRALECRLRLLTSRQNGKTASISDFDDARQAALDNVASSWDGRQRALRRTCRKSVQSGRVKKLIKLS